MFNQVELYEELYLVVWYEPVETEGGGVQPSPPRFLLNSIFDDLGTRDGILSVINCEGTNFLIFNRSFTVTIYRPPPMPFSVETRKKIFKNIIFKNYQINFTLSVKQHSKTSVL